MAIRERIDRALRLDSDEFRKRHVANPVPWLESCGRKYPPKLREAFSAIYGGRTPRAAIKANRGGGKSTMLADLAACMYLFRLYDVFLVGGSEDQAKKCYQYASQLLQIEGELEDFTLEQTKTLARSSYGNWIQVAAASTKRVRGPHCGDPHKEMGMKPHGGMLIIDEECETDDDIVMAARYTINTAEPGLSVRASTLHKVTGSFADLCENPNLQQTRLFGWGAFDTTTGCVEDCRRCIPQFAGSLRNDWEKWRKEHPEFRHEKGYCEGRAKIGGGWRKLWGDDAGSIISSFHGALSATEFEVEELGLGRPQGGYVLDRTLLDQALRRDVIYMPDMPTLIVIDWGFKGWTAAILVQMQPGGKVVPVQVEFFHLMRTDEIMLRMKAWREMFGVCRASADASHPFQNAELAHMGFAVDEVNFNEWKEFGAAWLTGLVERGALVLRGEKRGNEYIFDSGNDRRLYEQLKGWKRGRDGKIVKQDDHGPDALLCAAKAWGQGGAWSAEYESVRRIKN